jgi:hypothetical protein
MLFLFHLTSHVPPNRSPRPSFRSGYLACLLYNAAGTLPLLVLEYHALPLFEAPAAL